MPQDKKPEYIEEIKEKLGINYHIELIDFAKQKLEERKKKITIEQYYKERGLTVKIIGYICDPHKIDRKAIDKFTQKDIYNDSSFHCPCRAFNSFEDETVYFRECNRPEISGLMRKLGVSDIEELEENYFFEAEALAVAICENKSTFGLLRQFYRKRLPRQTIESIINRANEIIEKTKSQ